MAVPPRVAVVDYGMGNLASVAKALARSGADVRVTQSAAGVRLGEFDGDLTPHFLRSLATQCGMTLHVRLLAGSDAHHIVEAVFKAFARALSQACERHGRDDEVPSTKGTL